MNLTISTPALLFPAVSLIMLAYTNRFFHIANLTRNLYSEFEKTKEEKLIKQIYSLKQRLKLIRNMQIFGVFSLLLCVICMLLIYLEENFLAGILFGSSLFSLIISLSISIWEIQISIKALSMELDGLEK
jgi:membrane protein required for beta-lactamase induction